MLDNPEKYDRQQGCDPVEPDYRGDTRIAMFFANTGKKARPHIFSHAHGGITYKLGTQSDPESGDPKGKRGTTEEKDQKDPEEDFTPERIAEIRALAEKLAKLDETEYELRRTKACPSDITLKHLDKLVEIARREAKRKERDLSIIFDLKKTDTPPQDDKGEGCSMTDFYAVLPLHKYMFVPTRDMWPAETINGLFGRPGELDPPNTVLDKMRGVQAITWAPGFPLIVNDKLVCDAGWLDRKKCRTLNLYRPPALGPGNAKDVLPWLDHLKKIYPDDYDHIVNFLAHRVQRPQEKINHALVLAGPPGIGKDTILEPVKFAIGPWNFVEVSPKTLTGHFTGFLKSVILRVSEARDLGDVDRYAFYETTKAMWAAPPDMLRVNEKNLREYHIVNVLGGIVTTNHRTDGLYLPADDRRHFVTWSEATKEDADFQGDYWKNLWGWYYGENGIENVAAYLRRRNISGFDPKAPPRHTRAFWAMVDSARPSEEAELYDILEEMLEPAAVTLDEVIDAAKGNAPLRAWLSDRKNSRSIPHKLDRCGYVALRNDAQKGDGRWKIGGVNKMVYVKKTLSGQEQFAAAARLKKRYDDAKAAKEAADAENAARRAGQRTHYSGFDDFEKNGPKKGKPKSVIESVSPRSPWSLLSGTAGIFPLPSRA